MFGKVGKEFKVQSEMPSKRMEVLFLLDCSGSMKKDNLFV